MAFHPTLLSGFGRMQADPGDTRIVNYFLEHTYLWLKQAPTHQALWDAPFFHPFKGTFAFSVLMIGTAPIYWVLRALGFRFDTSMQLWTMSMTLLNFAALWIFLRRLIGFSSLACSVGAFLFAFSGSRVAQMGHMQLYQHFFSVICLYAVVRVFQQQKDPRISRLSPRAWIAVFWASFVLQLYAEFYLGFFLVIFGTVAAGVAACRRETREPMLRVLRRHAIPLFGGALVSLALLYPMMSNYLVTSRLSGYRTWSEVRAMLPRIHSWFFRGDASWLYFWQPRIRLWQILPMPHEHLIGVGLATSWLVYKGAKLSRSFAGLGSWSPLLFRATLVLMLIVTIFPGHVSLWWLFYKFYPGAGAIRAVTRIGLLLLIPAAIALAAWVDRADRRSWKFAALLALVVIEQGMWPASFDLLKSRAEIQEIRAEYQRVARNQPCDQFFFTSTPPAGEPPFAWKLQTDAMMLQLELGLPTVNGYSGVSPPGWQLWEIAISTPDDESRLRSELARWSQAQGLDLARTCWINAKIGQ